MHDTPGPFTTAQTNVVTPPPMPLSAIVAAYVIVTIIMVSGLIYPLLRFIYSRFFHSSVDTFAEEGEVAPPNGLLDSLPMFTFGSITGNLTGDDCGICLSDFEPQDQLRILPCCHAFHPSCINPWAVANPTCPMCRSSIIPSADRYSLQSESLHFEFGSVDGGGADREHIPDDDGYEVSVPIPEQPGDVVAAEVYMSNGINNWLRDYVDDRLASSPEMSFRSSGRSSPGSSLEDLEANRTEAD